MQHETKEVPKKLVPRHVKRYAVEALPGDALWESSHPWAFVLYAVEGEQLWHQRRRICSVRGSSGSRDFIVTPDGDVYEEALHEQDAAISAVRFGAEPWPPPPGTGESDPPPRRSGWRRT